MGGSSVAISSMAGAVAAGLVDPTTIATAFNRLFRVNNVSNTSFTSPERRSRAGVVMYKNGGNVFPLDPRASQRIVVVVVVVVVDRCCRPHSGRQHEHPRLAARCLCVLQGLMQL